MSATNGIADGTNGITLLPCPWCKADASLERDSYDASLYIQINHKEDCILRAAGACEIGRYWWYEEIRGGADVLAAMWNRRAGA